MAIINRFPGKCLKCGKAVAAGEGYAAKSGGGWVTYDKEHLPAGESKPDGSVPRNGPSDEIRLDIDPGANRCAIRPSGFPGGALFGKYTEAVNGNGGRYEPIGKYNWCPFIDVPRITEALKAQGFKVIGTPALAAKMTEITGEKVKAEADAVSVIEDIDARLSAQGRRLYPYQREGARQIASSDGFLLFDDMGLGKTVQALAAMPIGGRAVVIGPKIAKGVWRREIKTWRSDLRATVLEGRNSFRWPEAGEVVITGYPILPADVPAGCPQGVMLIADEAHAVRNKKSTQSARTAELSKTVRAAGGKCVLLTATPMDNKPFELWTLCTIAGVERRAFGNWPNFIELFEGRQDQWRAWSFGTVQDVRDAQGRIVGERLVFKHQAKIAEALRRVSLRRMKVDVLTDLPPKTYRDLVIELDPAMAKECDAVLNGVDLENVIAGVAGDREIAFERISELYARLSTAKIPAMLEEVEAFEEAGTPLIVFSPHRAPIDILASRPGWRVITGDTSVEERSEIEALMQAGRLKGVGGTIQAMGTALTMTHASNELFVGRAFTPGWNLQAEDRCYRIGQKRAVQITRIIAEHPLDERITAILDAKQALIAASVAASTIGGEDRAVSAADRLTALGVKAPPAAPSEPAPATTEPPTTAEPATEAPEPAQMDLFPTTVYRAPETEPEQWMARGLATLAGNDPDGASERNDVGFNRLDGTLGHSLAKTLRERGGLTDRQWNVVRRMLPKYARQIGAMP